MRREDMFAALDRMQTAYDAARSNPVTGDPSLDVYLADLPPDRSRLVQELSVPHWFNLELVQMLAPDVVADGEAAERFRSLPFVLRHPRGLCYHDSVRASLRAALVRSDPERVREVSRSVVDVIADEEDEESLLERLYCTLATSPDIGMDRVYGQFQVARGGSDLSRCHTLLSLAEEQEPLLDERGRIRVEYMRGLLQLERHDYQWAAATLQELRRRVTEDDTLPKLDLHIGMTLEAQGDWRGAMHHYRSTLRRVQRNPGGGRSSHTLEARLYQRLAFAELSAGQLGKAERHVRKSMKLNAITGEEYGLAINHELLGQVNLRLGEATAAEKELRKSLEIVESLGRYDTRARVLKHLAGARRLRGELDDALSLYGLAIDGLRRYADGFEVAVTELDRGALYHEMDDTDGALRCYHRALQIFGEYRHHIRQGQALRRIAAVHAARGDTETALAQLERALSLIPTESELARSVRHELRRYRKLRYRPPVGVVQRLVGLARRAMGALPGVRGKS